MGTGDLQGWHADPFKIHEARYFSDGQPTKLVRDGSAESYDEPPASDWDPAAVAITATGAAATVPGPAGLGGPGPTARDARQYSSGAIRSPGRPRSGAIAGAALLVAAAVVGGLVITNKPQAALSPVAFVKQSAQQTLAQRTAHMAMSMTIGLAGHSVTMRGTGELNFSTDAMAIEVDSDQGGQQFGMKEILVNGTLYFAFIVDGQPVVDGGSGMWWSMKVEPGAGTSFGGDPYTMLSQIEREGITLRPLGTRVVGGVTCTGYAITPPGDSGLSTTITIWADSQALVREISTDAQMSVPGSDGNANLTMDFSNFGAPVHITAPPSGTTYSA